jgi:hypothetical protein
VKKKSAKNKSASNNADMVGDDALPSNNDVDAANVPDAPTKLHVNQFNLKAPSQPPKATTAASAKFNKTPSDGNVAAKKPGESAKHKKRLPVNIQPSNVDPRYPGEYLYLQSLLNNDRIFIMTHLLTEPY